MRIICFAFLLLLMCLPSEESAICQTPNSSVRIAVIGNQPAGWSGWTKLKAFAGAEGIQLVPLNDPFKEYSDHTYKGILHFGGDKYSMTAIRDLLKKRGGRVVMLVDQYTPTDIQSAFGVGVAKEPIIATEPGNSDDGKTGMWHLAGESFLPNWTGLTVGMHTTRVQTSGIKWFLVTNPSDPMVEILGSIPSRGSNGRLRTLASKVMISTDAKMIFLSIGEFVDFIGADPFFDQYDNQEASMRLLRWIAWGDQE